jgi:hypothetical protein
MDQFEGFGKLKNFTNGKTQLGYWKNGQIIQNGFGGAGGPKSSAEKKMATVESTDEQMS